MLAVGTTAGAAEKEALRALRHVRRLIHAAQIPDGALRVGADPKSDRVWVVPYFAHWACVWLLESEAVDADPGKLACVRRWLAWSCRHQESDGTIRDYKGKLSGYKRTERADSTDAYAATFLMVARRQLALRPKDPIRADLARAARKALSAIELTWDGDGLTWARPDYKVKYLMDNIEVNWGLQDGAMLFDALGDTASAGRCRKLRKASSRGLAVFRPKAEGPFAFALHESGKLDGGLDKWYPHGMANLYALAAFKDAPRPLWLKAQRRFPKELRSVPALWLLAAHRCGDAQAAARYRAAVVQLAQGMSLSTHRLDQLAHALGALVCDRASLPLIPLPPTAP